MKLDKKKKLAAKTLKVGLKRINFDSSKLDEIKEAITKQDIRDLKQTGTIKVKQIKGRRKNIKRKTKKRDGKIKKKVNKRKQEYVRLTRKLRAYVSELKKQKKISLEDSYELRKKIRARDFRSKRHLQEFVKEMLK